MDGEITTIAFSTVVGIEDGLDDVFLDIFVYINSGGVEIYSGEGGVTPKNSDLVWLQFHVPESFKIKEDNDHLRVKFICEGYSKLKGDNVPGYFLKSCGFHLLRRYKEKVTNLLDDVQVTKRSRDDDEDNDDGNFESRLYPQQKRHSSPFGN